MKLFVNVLVVVGLITFSSCSKKDKAEEPVKEAQPLFEIAKVTIDSNGNSSFPTVTLVEDQASRIYFKHPGENSTSWLIYLGFGKDFISITLPSLEKKVHKFDEVFPSTTSASIQLNNVYYTTVKSGKITGNIPGTITLDSVSESIISGSYDMIATKYSGDSALPSFKLKGSFVARRENWDYIAR